MKTKSARYWIICAVSLAITVTEVPVLLAAPVKLHPIINENSPHAIPGQYIVVFKSDKVQIGTARQAVRVAEETVKRHRGKILFTYNSVPIGFAAKLPPAALKVVQAMPQVEWIEADQIGSLTTVEQVGGAGGHYDSPTGSCAASGAEMVGGAGWSCAQNDECDIHNNCPACGLDRIDQRLLPLNNLYNYSAAGSGAHVYVIDTGVQPQSDFTIPLGDGVDYVNDGNGTSDVDGHGTVVAGIIGGCFYGVAKAVTIHPVRVWALKNEDSTDHKTAASALAAGIQWVTENAKFPAVANISVWVSPSPMVDAAVTASITKNITYVVAAADANGDACQFSPAEIRTLTPEGPQPIVVGASAISTDSTGVKHDIIETTPSYQSNTGKCVSLFAPGEKIYAHFQTGHGALFGTAPATAHVAGVAALRRGAHPSESPTDVWAAIHKANNVYLGSGNLGNTPGWEGLQNYATALQGTPNELLHWDRLDDVADPIFPCTIDPGFCDPPPCSMVTVTDATPNTTIYLINVPPYPHPRPSPTHYDQYHASPLVFTPQSLGNLSYEAIACNSSNFCSDVVQAHFDCSPILAP